MNPDMDHKTDFDAIERVLAAEEEIVPSSGFAASVMERVREEAAMPAPIPFPWKRAIPGILLTAGVLGWGAWEAVRTGLPDVPQMLLSPPSLSPAAVRGLEDVGWVALALAVSYCSWALSARLVRRSSLL
ncbi:MAG: hypothetical protein ACLQG3_08110 [Terracidiphilus sp.]